MHVDTMRAIDRWVGIPLCFALTIVQKISSLLRSQQDKSVQRILFIELSEMGSTILVDPALQKARRELDADLYFLIFAKNKDSLTLTGTIAPANVRTIREGNLFSLLYDTLSYLFWVRKNQIDTVVDLELFSRFTALLSGLSGCLRRVGFYSFHNEGLYRGEMLTHRVAYNPHLHISKNFIAMINALLADQEEIPYSKTRIDDSELVLPKFECGPDELAMIREKIMTAGGTTFMDNHLVLINPNASELLPQRRWMMDRYEALIAKILVHRQDLLVLITGAPGEREEAGEMCKHIDNDRCINFAGALKLTQLPALYSMAALMVTNDSGPGHFSSITDMPTFVLFGPETPALYGSLGNATAIYAGLACSPCVSAANHRKTPCTDNKCLQAISVDQVFAAIRPLLDQLPATKEQ